MNCGLKLYGDGTAGRKIISILSDIAVQNKLKIKYCL